jgi:hypothetical protein
MNTSHESFGLDFAMPPSDSASRVFFRQKTDVYGQPLILTKGEKFLHTIARSIVIGVALGFSLAILLLYVHQSPALKTITIAGSPPVPGREASS